MVKNNRKSIWRIAVLAAVLVLLVGALFMLSSCGESSTGTTSGAGEEQKSTTETDKKFTITWKNYDGTTLKTVTVAYGTMPSYSGTPTKTADVQNTYTFSGWSPEVVTVTGNVTYTAQYKSSPREYTLTWKNHDGRVMQTDTVAYGGAIPAYKGARPEKPDMNFRGWTYNDVLVIDERGTAVSDIKVTQDMTLVAQFAGTAKLTVISNMPEAGTYGGGKECAFYSNCEIFAHPKQGYRFVGWYQINNETLAYDILVATEEEYKFLMWTEDVTIQATFEIASFGLTIFSNNPDLGLVIDTASTVRTPNIKMTAAHPYLSTVTVSAITQTDTYRFLGWYDEKNQLVSPNAVYTFTMVNYDYTLEAKWNRFTITYELDGGTNAKSNPATYAAEDIVTLAAPTRTGYDFCGWTLDGETVKRIEGSTVKHITLTATWKIITYTITYQLNGGTNAQTNPATYTVEDTVTLAKPTRKDYAFLGWYLDIDMTQEVKQIVKGTTGNLIFYAKWEYGTDGLTYTLSNGTYTVSGYSGNEKNVIIPKKYLGVSVTSIGSSAFRDCTGLTSVTIPSSVTSIGSYAFSGCTGLTSVTIPSSVTSIGGYAFYCCTGLTSVTIPSSVTSIGGYAFCGCRGLTSVTFAEGSKCTSIERSAFDECTGLTSVTIPPCVTSIGYDAFYGCYKLVEVVNQSSLNIQAGSSSYGYVAYYAKQVIRSIADSKLSREGDFFFYMDGKGKVLVAYYGENTDVVIPDGTTGINQGAFYHDTRITSVTIPSSVTSIGDSAFWGCTGLTSVTIRQGVTSIGDWAFGSCTGLTSVTIPSSVTSIGRYAFRKCTGLTSVTIPSSVTSIGEYAFSGCTQLTIYCEAASKPSGWYSNWNYSGRPVVWGYKG